MALTAAEQKQIREALCAMAVAGHHAAAIEQTRLTLTDQFEKLKAAAAQPVTKEK
ncbi:hypothetical protein [Paraburkholderia phenoliruptrix]|uniref:hypothetical protein n=1 Tax=Paraburkholderia phenoliruptrix TaxID=252970 RepID=UPI001C4F6675|nr:hypothetical protein [Paraburkholderia phenoliruptrix]MBW0450870.1 hypothetical protein [Paraburkholderia phenoliruptrix]MBW9100963.1 hypothetical protein [Paraburkholderia phenoliruptrix]